VPFYVKTLSKKFVGSYLFIVGVSKAQRNIQPQDQSTIDCDTDVVNINVCGKSEEDKTSCF
jgi:hypothetical protein